MFRNFKVLLVVFVVIAIAGSAYAFAAAITDIPTATAGEGKGAITGFAAADIKYTVDEAANPAEVDNVTFTLTGSAGTEIVKVQLDASVGTWYPCTYATSTWTCPTAATADPVRPQLLLGDIDQLRVIAYSGVTINGTPMP